MSALKGDFRVSEGKGQDAMMVDVGDKDRPPGDPPDAAGTWVKKVVGGNVGGMPVPEEVLDDDFVLERLCLEFPDGEDGEPVITIGNEVLEAMNGLWKNCMLVKVLGRSVPLAVLSKKLRELWKPSGAMYVMDLPRQFFMVRFGSEEEYLAALTGGPWRVFGSYLMVQAWAPEFDPMKDEIVTTPVWVRLASIPVNFYHKSILMGIAKGLGKPVRVDMTTLNFERARFARVCVEINLKKPLKGTVKVNGERYYVAYEGLTNICSSCGMYGHLIHNCPTVKLAKVAMVESQPEATEGLVREPSQPADGFTVVGRGGKRMEYQKKKAGGSAGSSGSVLGNNRRELEIRKDSGNISLSNSFGKLREDLAGPEGMENTGVSDSNKENVNNSNQLRIGERDTQGKSIHFGAGMEMNKVGNRFLNKEKRPLAYKAIVSNGPKPRYQNMNRPTRGLVFGQRRDEPELSKSGKRLRVERSNLGKSGGAVVYGKDVSSFGSESKQTTLDASRISQVESGQSTEQMEEALGIVPVEMEDASCVA